MTKKRKRKYEDKDMKWLWWTLENGGSELWSTNPDRCYVRKDVIRELKFRFKELTQREEAK